MVPSKCQVPPGAEAY